MKGLAWLATSFADYPVTCFGGCYTVLSLQKAGTTVCDISPSCKISNTAVKHLLCDCGLMQHRQLDYSVAVSSRNGAKARTGSLRLLVRERQHAVRAKPLPVWEAERVRGRISWWFHCRGNWSDARLVLHSAGFIDRPLRQSSFQKPHLPWTCSCCVSALHLPVFLFGLTCVLWIRFFKPLPPVGASEGYMFLGRPSVPLSVRPFVIHVVALCFRDISSICWRIFAKLLSLVHLGTEMNW